MLWAGRQLSHSEGLITIGGAASCSSEKYPQLAFQKHMYQVTFQLLFDILSEKLWEKSMQSIQDLTLKR